MSHGKIVLMACGSFSPPTYMHMRMFEIARDYIHSSGLGTVVGGIVSPVHDDYGKKDLVPATHRIEMLKLGLKSSGWVKVSEWETQQTAWCRTRLSMQYHQDTLTKHKSSHSLNEEPPTWLPDDILNVNSIDEPDNLNQMLNGNVSDDITLKLLCGADLLESFATPGLWFDEDIEAIVGRYGIVVVSRAGSDPGRFIHESDILYKYRRNVILVTNYIQNEVSSTVIRRLMRRGESAKYLTDDSVISYITQNRLYGSGNTFTKYTEYINFDVSPNDVIMTSPQETYKNIFISIRDKPSIIDETVTVKKPKSILSHGTVMPIEKMKPKMAYVDKVSPHYVPGKAVKIVSDTKKHEVKEKVGSLDSFLNDVYENKRRLSDGNIDNVEKVRKRCSTSTIRKLKTDDMRKSKSEVSKLCEKMKSIKLKEKEGSYKTRSCNDIVRLVLTKHGIHVISDTEAIV